MVRVVTNDEMDRLGITMSDIVERIRSAYRGLGSNTAQSKLRERLHLESKQAGEPAYFFGHHLGADAGVVALRVDSMFMRRVETDHGPRTIRASDFAGFVMLFSLETAELIGIVQDHWISTRRVAATSALGAEVLARGDSRIVGLFGTGEQASQHVPAVIAVRPVEQIRVYSPNREHRVAFAKQWSAQTGREIIAVDEPDAAVKGCDIVMCATNAQTPVLKAQWLGEGTHLSSIVGGDGREAWYEIDADTVARAAVIAVNSKAQAVYSRQPKLLDLVEAGRLDWDEVRELAELASGQRTGRTDPRQITLHDNNCGMGVQFAAVGSLVLERALATGVGTDIDSELFMTRGGTYVP